MEEKKQKKKEQKTDVTELDQKVKEHQAVLLKYPKNIRQVGECGEGKRIYVEDYVMTLMMYLAGKTGDGYGSAVLLGKKAVVEGRGTLFISGAVELLQQWRRPEEISSTQWTFVYDQMQKYFQDAEILGWFLTHPGMDPVPDEEIRAVWRSGFDGVGEVLLLYDNISREEAFYACKDGEFKKQPGYYIYYEKNEEMQNYMVEVKGGKSSDEGYRDAASEKMRQKFAKKQELQKKNMLHQQAAYAIGIFAGAIILTAAAGNIRTRGGQQSLSDRAQEVETISKKNEWVLRKEPDAQKTAETAKEQGETSDEADASGEMEGTDGAENGTIAEPSKDANGEQKSQEEPEGTGTAGEGQEDTQEEDNGDGQNAIRSGQEGAVAEEGLAGDGQEENASEEEQIQAGKTQESGQESSQESGQNVSQESGQDASQESGQNASQESGQNASQKTVQNTSQESGQDASQETAQKNNSNASGTEGKKKRYEVKKGDTLESISIAWYGSSSYVKKIKRVNKLENADKIYIGQVLILP